VSINVRDPYSLDWINGYAAIQKTNTGEWKTFEFLAPFSDNGFVELGLYAYDENFTVSKIYAAPYQTAGRVALTTFNSTVSADITDTTNPPTAMVYLPFINESENIQINATTYGKQVVLELYDGVIQPWETTGWWLNHDLAARSPNSIVYGITNPTLNFTTQNSGLYTLVVVLRQAQGYDSANTRVDLQITETNSTEEQTG